MENNNNTFGFVRPDRLLLAGFCYRTAPLVIAAFGVLLNPGLRAQGNDNQVVVIPSYHNDVSPALRDVEPWPVTRVQEHEAAENDAPKPEVGDDGTNVVSVDFTKKK